MEFETINYQWNFYILVNLFIYLVLCMFFTHAWFCNMHWLFEKYWFFELCIILRCWYISLYNIKSILLVSLLISLRASQWDCWEAWSSQRQSQIFQNSNFCLRVWIYYWQQVVVVFEMINSFCIFSRKCVKCPNLTSYNFLLFFQVKWWSVKKLVSLPTQTTVQYCISSRQPVYRCPLCVLLILLHKI